MQKNLDATVGEKQSATISVNLLQSRLGFHSLRKFVLS